MPVAESLASASLGPGSGSTPNRSTAARNDRSKAWLAAWARISSSGKRFRMMSAGRPPAGPVELHHRLDVRRGADDNALGGDRLGERPLHDAAVDGGRPNHVT